MNPEETQITGMISTCAGPMGTARLDYLIDLVTNKVTYIVQVHRKGWSAKRFNHDGLEGRTELSKFAEAKTLYDTACESCSQPYNKGAEA